MKLHASGEDYLEAILMLQKKNGMVRSIDLPGHGRPRDRRAYEHGTPDGQRPQAESLSAAKGADGR